MPDIRVSAELGILVVVQQVMLNAILASRFDPLVFQEKAKLAREQLRTIAASGAGPEASLYEQQFDSLLMAFHSGEILFELPEGRAS